MSTKKSAGRYSEICGATNNRGEPCSLPAGWGTPGSQKGRCKFHGGSSTGPEDTSHLEDNDFAEDNPGGGPPINNSNAEVHGGWSDPDKFYERLDEDRKEYVDELTESYVKESKADLPEDEIRKKARRLATYHIQYLETAGDTFERGWMLEEEIEYEGETYTVQKVNPSLKAGHRINSKDMKLMRELRVYGTPDGLPWTEQ